MIVACLFGGAGAALADVLLSNIGAGEGDIIALGGTSNSYEVGQAFTTGTSETGYTLESIELKLIEASQAYPPTVTLHADNSGVGKKVADFNPRRP